LNDNGTTHGVNNRRELNKKAVAGRLKNATLMLINQRIDEFLAVSLQGGECPFLVDTHETRISDYVRGKDRGEPARRTGFFVHSTIQASARNPVGHKFNANSAVL
jgi:hypothetical protein